MIHKRPEGFKCNLCVKVFGLEIHFKRHNLEKHKAMETKPPSSKKQEKILIDKVQILHKKVETVENNNNTMKED